MDIQDLIDAAPSGSIVNVSQGMYNEQLVINKPLTLQGPPAGEGMAIIDATGLANISTIRVLSSNVIIRRLTIQNGSLHGIEVGDASFVGLSGIMISSNHIVGNNNAGILTNYGASMTIDKNVIENNGLGSGFNRAGIILYPHGTTSITNNIITSNTIEGIFARESSTGLTIENNIIENHSEAGIMLAWDEKNVSIIKNTIKNCGTGDYDEQGGIVITQSMAEIIQDNIIENCSRSGIFWGWVPTTNSSPGEILITGNKIKNSFRDAIYLFSQVPGDGFPQIFFLFKPLIEYNILLDNGRAGVYVSNFYYYSPGNANPTIHYNDIKGNEWGVFNATAEIVNSTDNWWGNNSGPFHAILNPDGTGDPVSDNVDFIPWLTREQIIQIKKCAISAVTLEKYSFSPLSNKTSNVELIMKAEGNVVVVIDGTTSTISFEKYFSRNFAIKAFKTDLVSPTISSRSFCYASLAGNIINIKIRLYITIGIQGEHTISILPLRTQLPLQNHTKKANILKLDLSGARCNIGGPSFGECINTKIMFDICRFSESLFHNIDISDLL